MPACWSLGCQGPAEVKEAEPRDQRSRAFARLGSRHMGWPPPVPRPLCCRPGRGLLPRAVDPCQPSAGPCPPPIPGGQCPAQSCIHLNLSTWNHEFVVFYVVCRLSALWILSQGPVSGRRVWPHLLPFLLVDCLGHTWLPLGSSGSESLSRSLSEVKVCRTWRAERQLSTQPLGAGERRGRSHPETAAILSLPPTSCQTL